MSIFKKYQYKFWTFSREEISNLKPMFEQQLGIELVRDYENIWEWIWNLKNNDEIEFNISREHNWAKGDYDKPLRIIISSDKKIEDPELKKLYSNLLEIIKSDLYRGEFSLGDRELKSYYLYETLKYSTLK
ncbi:MAG TPA: hypothetical protein PLD02_10250 [Saprospiraceae bacterium]|nr:hypothetical protein [Saprospiraceae bacterium]